MTTFLPLDSTGRAIPALRLKSGGAHAVSVGASTARNSTGFDSETRIVSLYATVPVYIKTGDSSITATTSDHFFPAGVYYDLAIGGGPVKQATNIAVLKAGAENGTLYISEKE